MPELPEVERFRRYAEKTVLGRLIKEVEILRPPLLEDISPSKLRSSLTGRRFAAARRHGKVLFLKVDDSWLTLHFGMTGQLKFYTKPDEEPPYARFILSFEKNARLAYDDQRMFGRIGWTQDLHRFLEKKQLGPDALTLPENQFIERLRASRKNLKAFLMDQSEVAGIGNLYSDEIMYQAGLHPLTATSKLNEPAAQQVYESMRKVLETAIETGEREKLPDSYLTRHRTPDGRCPRCDRPLKIQSVGGRHMYFCPFDQKRELVRR